MNKKMVNALVTKGWVHKTHPVNSVYDNLSFGDYHLITDTSSWLILDVTERGSKYTRRIFDIHNPSDYEAGWTANLIMHLINTDAKLNREDKIDKILD